MNGFLWKLIAFLLFDSEEKDQKKNLVVLVGDDPSEQWFKKEKPRILKKISQN